MKINPRLLSKYAQQAAHNTQSTQITNGLAQIRMQLQAILATIKSTYNPAIYDEQLKAIKQLLETEPTANPINLPFK